MPHSDWLEKRRQGIGGSDVPALVLYPAMYKYRSPAEVWKDKLFGSTEFKSEAARLGRYLEPYIAKRFTEETGIKVRKCNKMLKSKIYPFMLGNIDYMVIGENAGLECKTTSIFNDKKFDDTDYPCEYFIQCQHYMAVTGFDTWYLAVLIGNKKFRHYTVYKNEAVQNMILKKEVKFWQSVLDKNNIWEDK
ncbi:MAG: putative phage-type endonuclease domain protein [Clostridia bacterium]|nr:putative phage-type endonuclease domain protein [Clostridia bacterium]